MIGILLDVWLTSWAVVAVIFLISFLLSSRVRDRFKNLTRDSRLYWVQMAYLAYFSAYFIARSLVLGGTVGLLLAIWMVLVLVRIVVDAILWFTVRKPFAVEVFAISAARKFWQKITRRTARNDSDT